MLKFGSKDAFDFSIQESRSISITRLLAILFVVYIHSYSLSLIFESGVAALNVPRWLVYFENLISQVVSRFAVPALFLISSTLLFRKERDWLGNTKGKVKSLVVPYLLWNTAWITVWLLAPLVPGASRFFSGGGIDIQGVGDLLKLYGIGDYPHVYQLWFLRDLFLFNIFAPVVWAIANRAPRSTAIVFFAIALLPLDLPFKQGLPWFVLGACYVHSAQIRRAFLSIPTVLSILVYIFCSLLGAINFQGIAAEVAIAVGVIAWLKIASRLEASKLGDCLVALSRWSFIVYAFHEPILTLLKKLCVALLPRTWPCILAEFIFIPVVVIAVCFGTGVLFKKVAPHLYALSTGGRA